MSDAVKEQGITESLPLSDVSINKGSLSTTFNTDLKSDEDNVDGLIIVNGSLSTTFNTDLKSDEDNVDGLIIVNDPHDSEVNNGVKESNEIMKGGTGTYKIVQPFPSPNTEEQARMKTKEQSLTRQSAPDQIDNVNKLEDEEDDEEPCSSWDNPIVTDKYVEAVLSPDDAIDTGCYFFSKSSRIEKKFKQLLFAVTYHEGEQMCKILDEEESSTLVALFTKRDVNGTPCIMKAIIRQSLTCIQPLLERFEDLDFKMYRIEKMDALQSDDGKNILHVAAQMTRDTEIILNIIDKYPWMEQLADSPDNCGTTPLMVACEHQNHAMARRLVEKYKAKIDHVKDPWYSPIYYATVSGSAETLKLFLAVKGARLADNQLELFTNRRLYENGTILKAILESKCSKTLQVCLDNGRDDIIKCLKEELNSSPDRAFIHAVCETPLVKLVKLAIEVETEHVLKRQDLDDVTPLMKATEARQLDIVKLILGTNSGKKTLSYQKRSNKETALMIACKKGFPEIVEFIMENSDQDMDLGQLDQDKRNVFHYSAKDDNILSVMIGICTRTEKYKNYRDYLKLRDNDGYVSLHHAASIGSHENVKLLLENGVLYDTLSLCTNRTALHYAACSNLCTVKVLLGFVETYHSADEFKQFVNAADSRLYTSLHIAASLGKWQTVDLLLQNGAIMKCDKENETPLHLAAYKGCTRTVQLLIQSNPSMVNNESRVGETAAMFAALNGKTETLLMLLKNNATLWAQSHGNSVEKPKTCLDCAVENKFPDTAKAILRRKNWKEVMKKSEKGPDELLASMVQYMPSVAIEVLDKCKGKTKHQTTEYDFFALQTEEVKSCGGKTTSYVKSMQALEAMAKFSRNDCLNHPVVQSFLDQKWLQRARMWYLCCLLVYTAFLISFTIYISLVTKGHYSANGLEISRAICYVFAILSIIKESFQVYHQRWNYFCMVSTYLELVMYICVFIFLPNHKKGNMQRQAGAIAIFLGWINYTWFLKRFPNYGIYIIMAKKIFVTFIKVFVPISFFVIAFSMAFFVLLHKVDNDGFDNILRSFVTSFVMMVGEVNYRGTFISDGGPQTQSLSYSDFVLLMIFLVLFLVLMSILLMNLLTGLAVGDIGVIMKKSLASKQIQQAMLIVELDRYLNQYPCLRATFLEPLEIRQKSNTCPMSCQQKVMEYISPRLDIEEEKKSNKAEEYQFARMQEQLDTMQNSLEQIKSSLLQSQPTLATMTERKSRARIQKRTQRIQKRTKTL